MPGETKSTTQTDMGPWKPAQGALTDIINQSQTLGGDTGLFKPSVGANTQDAWSQLEGIAKGGPNASQQALGPLIAGSSQGYQTGFGQLSATAQGNNLNPQNNPALMQYINNSNDIVANRVNGQFSGAGRYGGNGANTQALATQLGANTNGIMMDQYNRERSNQLNASNTLHSAGFQGAAMAPQLDQANVANANLLGQLGSAQDSLANAQQKAPLSALEWQKSMIAPIGGLGQNGSSTQTQSSSNPMGTILGGAMAIGGAMTGNPMMAMQGLGGLTGGQSTNMTSPMSYNIPKPSYY